MYNQSQDEKEYAEFLVELSEKTKDLMKKYQKLSPVNQKRISDLSKKIVVTQGMAGVMRFINDPFAF